MSKNFKNATYKNKQYAFQSYENELEVWGRDEYKGYVGDRIDCYELAKYVEDEGMIAKTENFMPKQSFLEQIYVYDIEDIKAAIKKRIEYLENYVKELEEQIAEARTIYNNFKNTYTEAMQSLEKSCEKWKSKDLFYAVRDTVKDRYPYC